ncbi:MAG: 1-deoxy-D-xylulose-5-phosphate reductoisomerase [Bacillota bacterium]|nr:1-deoxy-D-xylulose-5-phosphate reductoisomerase [Bacillota bacterium]
MRPIAIVGATGSIGRQAVEVMRRHREKLALLAAAARSDWEGILALAREFPLEAVALLDREAAQTLQKEFWKEGISLPVLGGEEGLEQVAGWPGAERVLSAAWGSLGLRTTLRALEAGKDVALANKESLVVGGPLVKEALQASGRRLIPVDSEHTALFQILEGRREVPRALWLTASGGPFLGRHPSSLWQVTVEEALAHPTWRMGARITIDSATLFNKGLEVMEAHHFFGVDYDKIQVVIHPQSYIHSLVEFSDGAFLAHMGAPDMKGAIQYALSYPERWEPPAAYPPPTQWPALQFAPVDGELFPALALCYKVGKMGHLAPAVMNGAKEEGVEAFLAGRLALPYIAAVAGAAVKAYSRREDLLERSLTVEAVEEAVAFGRNFARLWMAERSWPKGDIL